MKKSQETSENISVKSSKLRKAISVVLDIVLYLFLAFSVFVLIVSLTSSKNDGASNIFGYEMRLVVSNSMEKSEFSYPTDGYDIKEIKVKSVVFIERVPEGETNANEWYASLKEGDVLTFKYVSGKSQDVITHRIREITPTDNGYYIVLSGDNRANEDSVVSEQRIYTSSKDYTDSNDKYNSIIGKVVGQSVVLGYVVYGVSQPVGLALIVILPCTLIMIWQIARIVSVVNEDKKAKAAAKVEQAQRLADEQKEQNEQQARELEELKRKVAELEQSKQKSDEGNDESV